MKPEDLDLIRVIVQARTGFVVDVNKVYLIENRLAPLVRREAFDAVSDLVKAIRTRREDRLMWAVADAMTPNETTFFRDRTPFIQFRESLLPALARARGSEPIKIWSAGCATGEEAYSLAMIVDDVRANLSGARIEIFASDLSERCLEKAQAGLYTQFEVQRGLPVRQLVRHFDRQEEMWILSPRIRQMVRWRRLNLIADLRSAGRFDVIFCRYVVNGFDGVMRKRVLEQLAMALNPDGFLVLGETETVLGQTDAFKPVEGYRGVYIRDPNVMVAA
jgi:chemotaxis protein methyltransferase CheR